MNSAADIWIGVVSVGVLVLFQSLALAWRLGTLVNRVKNIEEAVSPNQMLAEFRHDVDRRLQRLETHAGFWEPKTRRSTDN